MYNLLRTKLREHKDYKLREKKEYRDIPLAVLLHTYNDRYVVYISCSVRMPDPFKYHSQMDQVMIFDKNYHLIAKHSPALDPYVDADKNILSVTSDGKCWVYDLDKDKEVLIDMPIVAFDHEIETSTEYTTKHIPNAFVISGTGCPWGCESCEVSFELYIDKDTFECVDTVYIYPDDEDSEEDEDNEEDA